MKVLIIGSGGREDALLWKISKSPKVSEVYVAPGNAGTSSRAKNIPIAVDDIRALKEFVLQEKIDLTVVGPEVPLVLGIVDEFKSVGLRVFGPSKAAAQMEGSKIFAKKMMEKYQVPTAKSKNYGDFQSAMNDLASWNFPLVIKADGLAAGKGVVICQDLSEASLALEEMMENKIFGEAGNEVLIEEFLVGVETSLLAFTDGKTILLMDSAKDHKAVFNGDQGPNTGGMGAYSPAPFFTEELKEEVLEVVFKRIIEGLFSEGISYQGVLYAGLMLTAEGPKVLEFNARFGDPETQALMVRIESDIVPIMEAVIDLRLHEVTLKWLSQAAVCVVMASRGYPGSYEKGKVITGLDTDEVIIFQAGTKVLDGKVVTSGGRVLGVTALGETVPQAADAAYRAVSKVNFEGAYFRTDIGKDPRLL